MLIIPWVRGLLRHRTARLAGAAAGVALAVGLLGSIGAFLASARRDMTRHAIARVAVDWQVEAQPAADPAAVAGAVGATPGVTASLPVGFATTTGFQATVGGTTQATAAG